ncbi:hypothetical protein NDA13_003319 [Ustilago tritici]|nr:hypothetical protein NDA13_003319 [Ustilago tritici]
MKYLPTFNVLLIVVQTIAAVQLDQLQQPRFVKVRRNLSNDAGSSETQHSLERRIPPEFPKGIEKTIDEVEELSRHSGSQSKVLPDSQHLAGSRETIGKVDPMYHFQPNTYKASMHTFDPSSSIGERFNLAPPYTRPNLASETKSAVHENRLSVHDQQLENRAQALTVHREAIDEGMTNILTYDERLKSIEKALKKNKYMKWSRRLASKGAILALMAATVISAGTSLSYQSSSSKNFTDMANRIQAQQGEINKLRELNEQQGGAMVGQGVAATTGRGTSDGEIV